MGSIFKFILVKIDIFPEWKGRIIGMLSTALLVVNEYLAGQGKPALDLDVELWAIILAYAVATGLKMARDRGVIPSKEERGAPFGVVRR